MTHKAKSDLYSILNYISFELKSPQSGASVTKDILSMIYSLGHMPMRHKKADKDPWNSMGIRRVSVRNYTIFYWPIEDRKMVYILRILYAGRDFEKLLEEADISLAV